MSKENVEAFRALARTWDGKDLRAFGKAWASGDVDLSILDPEVIYEDTILPDQVGETYHGRAGVAQAMQRWTEPYEQLTTELDRIVGDGDLLVSIHRVRSRGDHSGIEFDSPLAYLWRFRAGKVILIRSYWSPDEALAAAGLTE